MKRIALIGCGASGKSCLAKDLSLFLNVPVFDLDDQFWRRDIGPLPHYNRINIISNIVAKKEWIIDGDYASFQQYILPLADMIIFLDMPRIICIFNLLKRSFKNRFQRRHTVSSQYKYKSRFATLYWVWKYNRMYRHKILELLNEISSPGITVVIIRNLKDKCLFLNKLINNKETV